MHSTRLNFVRAVLLATIGSSLAAGPAVVPLGTAGNFAILAKSRVNIDAISAITGDVGVDSAASNALNGFQLVQDASQQFWTSAQVDGRVLDAAAAPPTPAVLATAVQDMNTAFRDAMTRPNPDFKGLGDGRIGGSVLTPGLYKWTTGVTISSDITLSGGPTDTWIFQISGSFNQASKVEMTLVGGALPQNIIWAIAGTVTFGSDTIFQGNILAKTNVDIDENALGNGCIFAGKAVSLDKATIIRPGGVAAPPPTSSPTTPPVTSTPPPTTTTSSPTSTFTPQCTPTATPCFSVAFQGLNASIQASDFLTFTLTDTPEECIDFCACVPGGCAFANSYFDNDKNTTMLTCAIYASCHTAADATNTGGQSLPNGGLSTVVNSTGFCLTSC
ncbi:Antifreeze protein [Mycena sanguinolenta]|uniref:Antifreeze protein n=1 Tax=Mycena sanguinolenta TaxID=230812 RepID=A0A8H6XFL2_9AGAR|nr:Antifreeze protein [Mycena sanguinolenta]